MSQQAEPILAVAGLVKDFGGVRAVNDCSFTVPTGAIVGLIGPNGSGKTTTFNLITGLERADAGTIRFEGEPIGGLPPHRITRQRLGRTFQVTRVFPQMTVLENMLVAADERHDIDTAVERAMHLLELINLVDLRDEFGGNLSYGQNKLIEIARVHMREHRLVLLDEPFAGVNPTLSEQLLDYVREMQAAGVTYLIVEHDMPLIMGLCEHVLVMDQGRLLTEGAPAVVRENPDVLAAYFGKAREA